MLRELLRSNHDEESLSAIFKNSEIVKILHGGDSDLKYLIADLEIVTNNVFDTARALSFMQRIPILKVA